MQVGTVSKLDKNNRIKYFTKIQELKNEANAKFPRQIVIDIFESVDELTARKKDVENPVERDEVGAIMYDITILREVFNYNLIYDLGLLERMEIALRLWYDDIEFRNKQLGIPREKG